MAGTAKPQTESTTSDDGWEDVVTESQVKLDTDGDEFIGTMQGWSETETGIAQAHFVSDGIGACFINCGWHLKMLLKEVRKGTLVRILRTGTQDTGQKTPMVLYKVQTKRS